MTTRSKKTQKKSLTTLVHLSPEEVASLPKPKEGFDEFAEALFALYADHETELSIKGQTPQNALAELEAYRALVEIERAAQQNLQLIQATRALRGASVWTTELNVYARGRSAGRTDVEMLREVSDFAHFLKHKSKKRAVAAPPIVAPVAPVVTP